MVKLEQELATETDPLKQFALSARIEQISEDEIENDIRTASLGFLVGYQFTISGEAQTQDDGNALGGSIGKTTPWPIEFWMGGWDADALCGFTSGTLEMPFKPQ